MGRVVMAMIHVAQDASMDSELRIETEQRELNRSGFVRAPNARAQWILLVNEAISAVNLPPADYVPLRNYLAITLERFTKDTDFLRFLNGYGLWQRALSTEGLSSVMAQQVADVGLLYVTVFRGYAEYRHNARSINFATGLTERLYYRLSEERDGKEDWESIALQSMYEHFGLSIMALRAITNDSHLSVKEDYFKDAVRFPTCAEAKSDLVDLEEFFTLVRNDDMSSN